MTARRTALAALAAVGLCVPGLRSAMAASTTWQERWAGLEARHGGSLGVAVLDADSGALVERRGDQRFPLCSVGKLAAAAFVLARVDAGRERLDRRIAFTPADLVAYSPETERQAGGAMTVGALCAASLTLSDNTAHNLLHKSVGGPSEVTAFVRSLGDTVTRFDRFEPALNDVAPGDERDTSTPTAMVGLMRAWLAGDALSKASRQQLATWLVATTTGLRRLRGGGPPGGVAGDKTGTGPRNATNDLAFFDRPGRGPLFVAALYVDSPAPIDEREGVLADVARSVFEPPTR